MLSSSVRAASRGQRPIVHTCVARFCGAGGSDSTVSVPHVGGSRALHLGAWNGCLPSATTRELESAAGPAHLDILAPGGCGRTDRATRSESRSRREYVGHTRIVGEGSVGIRRCRSAPPRIGITVRCTCWVSDETVASCRRAPAQGEIIGCLFVRCTPSALPGRCPTRARPPC